jgi:aspartate-semialdehyde dehydrogenase
MRVKFEHLESIRSLALVGATGLVGQEFLSLLTEHHIAIPQLKLLASKNSEGATVEYGEGEAQVEVLNENSFDGVDAAFFTVPSDITAKYTPIAMKANCLVVDDSSVFRMQPEVPLIVPEVNGASLRAFEGLLVATPNCSTTPLVLALKPLADTYGIKRVVVSTYQSVSGAGRKAYEELSEQTASLLNGASFEPAVFPHQIAFNLLPQIGKVTENGDCDEESKVVAETRKILGLPDLKITATTVRVPTFCGHGLSVNVELEKDFTDEKEIREIFDKTAGLKVLDQPSMHIYPTNIECIGSDPAFVGRVRRDRSVRSGLNLWVIADNLRKGAALNALQIFDTIFNYRRMA